MCVCVCILNSLSSFFSLKVVGHLGSSLELLTLVIISDRDPRIIGSSSVLGFVLSMEPA